MSFSVKHKQVLLFMVALAIMPLLFGNAIHRLIPCSHEFVCVDGHSPHSPCGSHDEEHEEEPASAPENSCPVCDFLAMPRDIAPVVAWDCILDLVEQREPEPVRRFVVLYCPFEPGRAPPAVS